MKISVWVLTVIGLILTILGAVRISSWEYKLVAGFGGTEELIGPVFVPLFGGIALIIIGIYLLVKNKRNTSEYHNPQNNSKLHITRKNNIINIRISTLILLILGIVLIIFGAVRLGSLEYRAIILWKEYSELIVPVFFPLFGGIFLAVISVCLCLNMKIPIPALIITSIGLFLTIIGAARIGSQDYQAIARSVGYNVLVNPVFLPLFGGSVLMLIGIYWCIDNNRALFVDLSENIKRNKGK